MFENPRKRLTLSKETVRALTGSELRAVVGGLAVVEACPKSHHCSGYCPTPTVTCATNICFPTANCPIDWTTATKK